MAKNKLKTSINETHIANLKDNLELLSLRPMGILSSKDPGGLAYQKALGKWEGFAMAEHDRKGGKKSVKKIEQRKK